MSGYVIGEATSADACGLAPRLRAADVEEIRAASGAIPIEALRRAFGLSTHVWALRDIMGQPLALWGVGPHSLLAGRGCPWLLVADDFETLGPDIARFSRAFLAGMRELYPQLENRVDARHSKAVRWLSWLGFTIDPAMPWGVEGRPFHRFWL